MNTRCKLTDAAGKTFGTCQWGVNISHTAAGKGKKLCTSALIHYYEHPLLAVFADPIHGNYGETRQLWEFRPRRRVAHDSLKSGCKTGTTIRRIELPILTIEQRVAIGILCAARRYTDPQWRQWARQWLAGLERSAAASAASAAWAAESAARSTADVLTIIQQVVATPESEWATLMPEGKA